MSLLADRFLELVRLANEGGDPVARFALFLSALGMLVLPAAGAVLKRRHFHRRMWVLLRPPPSGRALTVPVRRRTFYSSFTVDCAPPLPENPDPDGPELPDV